MIRRSQPAASRSRSFQIGCQRTVRRFRTRRDERRDHLGSLLRAERGNDALQTRPWPSASGSMPARPAERRTRRRESSTPAWSRARSSDQRFDDQRRGRGDRLRARRPELVERSGHRHEPMRRHAIGDERAADGRRRPADDERGRAAGDGNVRRRLRRVRCCTSDATAFDHGRRGRADEPIRGDVQFACGGLHQPELFRSGEDERRLRAGAHQALHERESALALPLAAGGVVGEDDDVRAGGDERIGGWP